MSEWRHPIPLPELPENDVGPEPDQTVLLYFAAYAALSLAGYAIVKFAGDLPEPIQIVPAVMFAMGLPGVMWASALVRRILLRFGTRNYRGDDNE